METNIIGLIGYALGIILLGSCIVGAMCKAECNRINALFDGATPTQSEREGGAKRAQGSAIL